MADEDEPIVESPVVSSQPHKIDFNPHPETNEWKTGLFSCTLDLHECENNE